MGGGGGGSGFGFFGFGGGSCRQHLQSPSQRVMKSQKGSKVFVHRFNPQWRHSGSYQTFDLPQLTHGDDGCCLAMRHPSYRLCGTRRS